MAKAKDASPEELVINFFPEVRISHAVVLQLMPYLPIKSFDELKKAVEEIEIEGQKLPTEAFQKHVREDLFPVKSMAELVEKVCSGVQHGLKVASSPTFPVRRRESEAILNAAFPVRAKCAAIGMLSRN